MGHDYWIYTTITKYFASFNQQKSIILKKKEKKNKLTIISRYTLLFFFEGSGTKTWHALFQWLILHLYPNFFYNLI